MNKRTVMTLVTGLWLAASASSQVDYRAQQSSVKNQGARGTCVAFSVCAAMETFPGVPTDLSEQMLYATVKLHQNSTDLWRRGFDHDLTLSIGDMLGTYASLAWRLGSCPEYFFPYNPNPLKLPDSVPSEVRRYIELAQVTEEDLNRLRMAVGVYRIVPAEDGLLELAAAQDVDRIKAELDAGRLAIPVSYWVHEPSWSNISRVGNFDASGVRDIVHPGMMDRFARRDGDWMTYNQAKVACMISGEDLLEGLASGRWVRARAFPENQYGGHAVTIVGYDGVGFIAKNSWGEEWGSGGYSRIAFDYHRLYTMEVLLIDRVEVDQWPSSSLRRTPEIRGAEWHLKFSGHADGERLLLSSWALAARQPDVSVIEYTVYGLVDAATWEVVAQRTAHITDQRRDWGAPLVLTREESARLRELGTVSVRVRYGYFPFDDQTKPEDALYPGERVFGPFSADAKAAIDLTAHSGR